MKYLSGIHALNLNCTLDTCGDWHQSALRWKDLTILESEDMFFKEYGIEKEPVYIPDHTEKFYVANHIRALLDLLEIGNFATAQGMNNDFICSEKYDSEVFDKVYSMRKLENWKEIDQFMCKEYTTKWVRYKEEQGEITSKIKICKVNDSFDLDNNVEREILKMALLYSNKTDLPSLLDLVNTFERCSKNLSVEVREQLLLILEYTDFEYVKYLINLSQNSEVDTDKLLKNLTKMFNVLDLKNI